MTPNRYSTMCKFKSTGMALLAVAVILLFPNDVVPNDNNVLGILFCYKSYTIHIVAFWDTNGNDIFLRWNINCCRSHCYRVFPTDWELWAILIHTDMLLINLIRIGNITSISILHLIDMDSTPSNYFLRGKDYHWDIDINIGAPVPTYYLVRVVLMHCYNCCN